MLGTVAVLQGNDTLFDFFLLIEVHFCLAMFLLFVSPCFGIFRLI